MLNRFFESRLSPESLKSYKSIYLGLCFMFLIASYITVQNLLTNVFAAYGFYSLILVYGFHALSALYGSIVVGKLGLKETMTVSAFVYVLFLVGSATRVIEFFLAGSVFLGLFSGPIWVAQGSYIGALTEDNPELAGKFSGYFFSFIGNAPLIGNLIIGIFFSSGGADGSVSADDYETIQIVLYMMIAMCSFSVIMFLFVLPVGFKENQRAIKAEIFAMKEGIKQPKLLLWLPYTFACGYSLAYCWSNFPLLIPFVIVPWIFAVYGGFFFLFGFVAGVLIDKVSLRLNLFIDLLISAAVYGFIAIAVGTGITEIHFVAAAFMGMHEALFSTMITGYLYKTLPDITTVSIGYFRCFLTLGILAGVIVNLYANWWVTEITCAVLLTLSILIVGVMFSKSQKTEPKRETENISDNNNVELEVH